MKVYHPKDVRLSQVLFTIFAGSPMHNSIWLDTMENPGSHISGDLANTCLIVMFSTKIGQFQEFQPEFIYRSVNLNVHDISVADISYCPVQLLFYKI